MVKSSAQHTMTVFHNDVKIHDRVAIKVDRTSIKYSVGSRPCEPGPLLLQAHSDPVQFRNIWLEQLDSRLKSVVPHP